MVRPPLSLGSGGYPILQLIRLDKVSIEPERDGVGGWGWQQMRGKLRLFVTPKGLSALFEFV